MTALRVVGPATGLRGEVSVPGDKSISHRSVILGALAEGKTQISGFLNADDCLKTAASLQALDVKIDNLGQEDMVVHGVGLRRLRDPGGVLKLGNSGTGIRLLTGVLAGQNFTTTLTGDESLCRRPMDRIAIPLGQMGIEVSGQGERCTPPVTVCGGQPQAITYHTPMASAQVKSAVLLAGLYADGTTTVIEPGPSRDHTERMLTAFGAEITVDALRVSVVGRPKLHGQEIVVPGDFSSAAFLLAAGLLSPSSQVTMRNVLLNPTRTGLLDILQRMGADVEVTNRRQVSGEERGNITARTSQLIATEVGGEEIPRMLDEVPILALLATQAEGQTIIRDAAELRVKESDRLATTAEMLRAFGAQVAEQPDGLIINGPTRLHGATVNSCGDHRIAMTAAVAGMIAAGETVVEDTACIDTSFPGFADSLAQVGGEISPDEANND